MPALVSLSMFNRRPEKLSAIKRVADKAASSLIELAQLECVHARRDQVKNDQLEWITLREPRFEAVRSPLDILPTALKRIPEICKVQVGGCGCCSCRWR